MPRNQPIDIYQQVTNSIIKAMEQSDGTVIMPWQRTGLAASMPKNASTDAYYQGCNVVGLWCAAELKNYPVPLWASY